MKCFPFMKDISGARCLLVGGGKVALRKAERLAPFGVRLTVCAHAVQEQLRSLADEVYAAYCPDLLAGAAFAIAATDDAALNARVAADCRARGIPVNSVDDVENCDFFFPALIERGSVTVGISTGGTSPALAAALRQYIEARLPKDLADIACRAEAARGTMPTEQYTAFVRRLLEESC